MECGRIRREHGIDVIIADAPSTDGSTHADVLADLGVSSVVVADGDKGLSQAVRVAFLHAVRQGYRGVILMDGNNKDDPATLPEFIKAVEKGYDYDPGCTIRQ